MVNALSLYAKLCLLTLSTHAREGFSSEPVCLFVHLSLSDFGDY